MLCILLLVIQDQKWCQPNGRLIRTWGFFGLLVLAIIVIAFETGTNKDSNGNKTPVKAYGLRAELLK